MARAFPQVRANTVSAFALGDYEWLLASTRCVAYPAKGEARMSSQKLRRR